MCLQILGKQEQVNNKVKEMKEIINKNQDRNYDT
jgi:hypothetical protein